MIPISLRKVRNATPREIQPYLQTHTRIQHCCDGIRLWTSISKNEVTAALSESGIHFNPAFVKNKQRKPLHSFQKLEANYCAIILDKSYAELPHKRQDSTSIGRAEAKLGPQSLIDAERDDRLQQVAKSRKQRNDHVDSFILDCSPLFSTKFRKPKRIL